MELLPVKILQRNFLVNGLRFDATGRGDGTLGDYPQQPLLEKYFAAAKAVDLSDLADSPHDGRARKKIVEERRLDAISEIHQNRETAC